MKRIAIDFDGTIVENEYPEIGVLRKNAKEVINRLLSEGYVIIINTCRTQEYEYYAKKFLLDNDIMYNYINCNTPEDIAKFGMDCRKISADVYVDDKCLMGIPDDWEDVYNILTKKLRYNGCKAIKNNEGGYTQVCFGRIKPRKHKDD